MTLSFVRILTTCIRLIKTLGITSIFIHELGSFFRLRGVLYLKSDNMLCSKYAGCVLPLHEYLFSWIGFMVPFNDFKVKVINI